MNYAYGDELAIVPYVKHEIVAIAPTHGSPIIFLNSPNYTISEKFALIKDYIDGLRFTTTHDDFDRYNMHVLAAPLPYDKIARNYLYYALAFTLCA